MNSQRALRSLLAALPLVGFWILDLSPNLPASKSGKPRSLIIYPQPLTAVAQPLVAAPDGTGTVVTPAGNRYDIQGGTLSGDRANLFHSFTRFGLDSGETANFIANPEIQNILTRVVGGDASLINGLIQVTGGNANLFLMNPAGVIFGPNARLDVPGSFLVTTASGIGMNDRWFNSTGPNNYEQLIGTPNAFYFPSQPGSIVNAGQLSVDSGQNLTLLGGTTINTGQLSASGGHVTVAAVPGENVVRIGQVGHLLSLEIAPPVSTTPTPLTLSPLSLPQLLVGSPATHATGLTVNAQGQVVLTATNQTVPTQAGTTIIAGAETPASLDVSSPIGLGGSINLVGTRVGVVGSNLNASGGTGGGTVRIGGDVRGAMTVPLAEQTYVDRNSAIAANAITTGNGGQVVLWANDTTNFLGQISAKGSGMGTGGFVEVSGKNHLLFNGTVDTLSANGSVGTLLLDPADINIVDTPQNPEDSYLSGDNRILGDEGGPTVAWTLSKQALENLAATADVILEANNNITISQLANRRLNLQATTGSVTFRADADRNGSGSFSMNPNDTISTQGGNLSIFGHQITVGNLATNGGTINLTTGTGSITAGTLNASNPSATGGRIILSSGADIAADRLVTAGSTVGGPILAVANGAIQVGSIATGGQEGGSVVFSAFDRIRADQIITLGTQKGGDISLTSKSADIQVGDIGVTVSDPVINASATDGMAGNVVLDAGTHVTVGAIAATGIAGGNVVLSSQTSLAANSIRAQGDLTLSSNEIDLLGGRSSLSSPGVLRLEPTDPKQNITVGGEAERGGKSLDLTSTDLGALSSEFASLKIGRSNGEGEVTVAEGVTFSNSIAIQSPLGLGTVTTGNMTLVGRSAIEILAGSDIKTANIVTRGGDIRLTSHQGNIDVSKLSTRPLVQSGGETVAGNVSVNSKGGDITIGAIDTSAVRSSAGEIGVIAFDRVTLGSIEATGSQGGNITITGPSGVRIGSLNAVGTRGSGNIVLAGNEIDLIGGKNSVTSNGQLILQPTTPNQNIVVGRPEETIGLDLTTTDLRALQDGFNSITIGHPQGGGQIAIGPVSGGGEVRFQDPTLIQAPASTGSIVSTGTIIGADNAAITLIGGSITTGDINANAGINIASSRGNVTAGTISTRSENGAGGNISIQSAGGVQLGNANAFGAYDGGDIQISARDAIKAGAINSSSQAGNAGASILNTKSDIEVVAIKAGGGAAGGKVEIAAGGSFRATGTFTDRNQVRASISTAGRGSAGSLTIQLAGGNCTSTTCSSGSFVVGNPKENGTAGAITDGQYTILPLRELETNFNLKSAGEINGVNPGNSPVPKTGSGDSQTPSLLKDNTVTTPNSGATNPLSLGETSSGTSSNTSQTPDALGSSSTTPATELENLSNPAVSSTNGSTTVRSAIAPIVPNEATGTAPEMSRNHPLNQLTLIDTVLQIDQYRGREYERYFGRNLADRALTTQNIRDTLSGIAQLTGVKSAIIYVSVQPTQLELRLFLPEGRAIFKSIPVPRETVLQVAKDFTSEIRNPQRVMASDYRLGAEQLYGWLITPLLSELELNGIQTLLFSMDTGLRTLPLAALYDGQKFLVEKYSVGLIPSLSLTDTRYANLRDSQVLAMGASQFPSQTDQAPLPGVPIELQTIAGNIWPGQFFLNRDFTLANLKAARSHPQYRIIHLATHGEFQPGGAENSYIQFWDTKLHLDQLQDLKLYSPPVELLVLSACTTAVGDEDAELGFAGLAVRAGVKSALASLWYVSDAGTLGLMTSFYQQLRTAPIKAEALRQAQLALLRGEVRLQDGYLYREGSQAIPLPSEMARRGDRNLSHPYYWAAFTMIGSPW